MRSSDKTIFGTEFPFGAAITLLVLIAGVVCSPSLLVVFQYDDVSLILDSAFLREKRGFLELLSAGRPIRTITMFFDYYLWGYSPRGFHLTNYLLHILCGCVWFAFIEDRFRNRCAAWWSALLFLCHPAVTETLAVVTHRKESLAFLFLTLSLWSYLKASRPDEAAESSLWLKMRGGFYALSFAFYLLGLGSKQVVIVAPALAFAADYFESNRPAGEIIRKRGAWLAPFVAIPLLLAILSLGDWRVFGIAPKEELFGESYWRSLIVSGKAVVAYMRILAWPVILSADHQIKPSGLLWAALGALIWLSMLFGGLRLRKRSPGAGFGLVWIALNLLMTLNLIPVNQPLAERYLYIPLAGFAFVVVETVFAFVERESPLWRFVRLIGLMTVVVASLYIATDRMYPGAARFSCVSLFLYAVAVSAFLAIIWLSKRFIARPTFWKTTAVGVAGLVVLVCLSAPTLSRMSAGNWKKPVFFNPERYEKFKYKYYHYKRGADVREFSGAKDVAESVVTLLILCGAFGAIAATIILPPWSGSSRMKRDCAAVLGAITMFYSGLNIYRMQDWRTQGTIWVATMRADPDSLRAYVNYGVFLVKHKALEKAEWYYSRAAQIDPFNPTLWSNLGQLYLRMNDYEGAEFSFAQTVKFDPKNTSARLNLANIYVLSGREDDALREYQKIIEIDPQNARAYYNVAVIQHGRGDTDAAIENCRRALFLRPDFDKAREMCGESP